MSYSISPGGLETRKDEEVIENEYKTYLKWIEIIKKMCNEETLVSRATGKTPEYYDKLREEVRLYGNGEDDMEQAEEWDDNSWSPINSDHYELDNGLHVYIKNGNVRIQASHDFYEWGKETDAAMELSDNEILFYLGIEGWLPYNISYGQDPEDRNRIEAYGNLPVRGMMRERFNIRDILEGVVECGRVKDPLIIERLKASIALYDKISDMVRQSEVELSAEAKLSAEDISRGLVETSREGLTNQAQNDLIAMKGKGKGKDQPIQE